MQLLTINHAGGEIAIFAGEKEFMVYSLRFTVLSCASQL